MYPIALKNCIVIIVVQLIVVWLLGRSLTFVDLVVATIISLLITLLHNLTTQDEEKYWNLIYICAFSAWISSPTYLLDWDVTWQKWPIPYIVSITFSSLLYSGYHQYSVNKEGRKSVKEHIS